MPSSFAAAQRAVEQSVRLDTALTRCFSARQRAWRRECWTVTLLALSLGANVVLTWLVWS